MNSKRMFPLMVLAVVLPLTACSGLKGTGSGFGGGGASGNAKVSVTLFDSPPSGVSLLSFSLPIVGISLIPSSGSPVLVYSPTTIIPTELTHLQADSAAIVTAASVAAGTYTSISVTVGVSSGVFVNANPNRSTITWAGGSCLYGKVCDLPNGAPTTVRIPLSLTLTANQNQWVGLNVNLNNAIVTTNNTTISVDFTQANTFTATTTPRTGIPPTSVDTVEDFTGTVEALSSSSITVQSVITGQSLTATINQNTQLNNVPTSYSGCTTTAASCLTVGSTISLDASLSSAGTFTATEIDILNAKATDEVEGIIYPTTTIGVVEMILTDKYSASGNSVLGAATTTYGTQIFLTASPTANYVIDTKTLSSLPAFIGFSGSGDLLAGQQVRVHISGVTSSANEIQGTADNIALRFSRISGTIGAVTGDNFTITAYPSYIGLLNTSLGTSPFVYTYPLNTVFDGVTGTGGTKFVSGASVAIRALYLNNAQPAFAAAKVRVP